MTSNEFDAILHRPTLEGLYSIIASWLLYSHVVAKVPDAVFFLHGMPCQAPGSGGLDSHWPAVVWQRRPELMCGPDSHCLSVGPGR